MLYKQLIKLTVKKSKITGIEDLNIPNISKKDILSIAIDRNGLEDI